MAQLNFYVPDKIEQVIRKEAQARGESISAYLAQFIKERLQPQQWQEGFFTKVVGGWQGKFPKIERPLPEEVDFS